MAIRVLSRACLHSNGLAHVTLGPEKCGSHIVGILILYTKDFDTLGARVRVVLDARLLERVLQALSAL
jgi:hypothetical protein